MGVDEGCNPCDVVMNERPSPALREKRRGEAREENGM